MFVQELTVHYTSVISATQLMGLFPEIIITPDNLRGARKIPNVSFYELFTVSDLSRYRYIRLSHVALKEAEEGT